MIIATSNFLYGGTFVFSTNGGSVLGGELNNLGTSNFAENATITPFSSNSDPRIISITLPNFAGDYLAIHGINFGDSVGSVTFALYAGAGAPTPDAEFTTNISNIKPSSIFLTFPYNTYAPGDPQLRIEFSSTNQSLTMSYIAAGNSTTVPYGGIRGGKVLNYLGYNYASKGTRTIDNAPMNQKLRKKSKKVSLNFPQLPIEWVRYDLQLIYNLYLMTQVLSMLDFEAEDQPQESWAAFKFKQNTVSTYDGTRALAVVNMTFEAVT